MLRKNNTNRGLGTFLAPDSKTSQYVYLMHCVGTSKYKIGRANKPRRRLSNINLASPFRIKIIGCAKVSNSEHVESWLHEQYQKLRLNGEWFELKKDQLNKIRQWLAKNSLKLYWSPMEGKQPEEKQSLNILGIIRKCGICKVELINGIYCHELGCVRFLK